MRCRCMWVTVTTRKDNIIYSFISPTISPDRGSKVDKIKIYLHVEACVRCVCNKRTAVNERPLGVKRNYIIMTE